MRHDKHMQTYVGYIQDPRPKHQREVGFQGERDLVVHQMGGLQVIISEPPKADPYKQWAYLQSLHYC